MIIFFSEPNILENQIEAAINSILLDENVSCETEIADVTETSTTVEKMATLVEDVNVDPLLIEAFNESEEIDTKNPKKS